MIMLFCDYYLVSVIVVLLWVGFLIAPSQSEGILRFDSTWGSTGAAATQFAGPTYVAVDSNGNVYVADTGNNRISKFDAAGGSAVIFVAGLSGPNGIAVDSSDNVYVADTGTNTIKKYSSAGVPDLTFPVIAGLSGPTSIAIDSAGKIYVADTGNNRVGVWTALGVLNLNLPGFTGPKGVACDPVGNIYVSDTGANRVHIYSSVGGLLYTFGTWGRAQASSTDPPELWWTGPVISAWSTRGTIVSRYSILQPRTTTSSAPLVPGMASSPAPRASPSLLRTSFTWSIRARTASNASLRFLRSRP